MRCSVRLWTSCSAATRIATPMPPSVQRSTWRRLHGIRRRYQRDSWGDEGRWRDLDSSDERTHLRGLEVSPNSQSSGQPQGVGVTTKPDSDDPQATLVYQAQSDVVLRHPEDDLDDLAAVRAYVAQLAAAERVTVSGCYRAWHHDDGVDMIVHRSRDDRDLVGTSVPHPADGREVVIVAWPGRYSHFDQDMDEIVVGGLSGGPLSHRLLIVHEVSHVIKPTNEKHGAEWVAVFERTTTRHLPHLAAQLRDALRSWQVVSGSRRRHAQLS